VVSSFPEPIAPAVALAPENRFPTVAAIAVSSVGLLLCSTMVFIWRTHTPPPLPDDSLPYHMTTPIPVQNVVDRPRVLIVDSNPSALEFERSVFVSAGLDVTSAGNGADAMRFLQEHRFNMAVLDAHMTDGVSCLDLLNWIKVNLPALRANLVLTTPSVADADRLQNSTSLRVLTKPLKIKDLMLLLPLSDCSDHAAGSLPAKQS
jgi:CheY-like chemotaxis protein